VPICKSVDRVRDGHMGAVNVLELIHSFSAATIPEHNDSQVSDASTRLIAPRSCSHIVLTSAAGFRGYPWPDTTLAQVCDSQTVMLPCLDPLILHSMLCYW
jgi:hypothetical protein